MKRPRNSALIFPRCILSTKQTCFLVAKEKYNDNALSSPVLLRLCVVGLLQYESVFSVL